jgi:GNAT superfamily N-acetyltransferase
MGSGRIVAVETPDVLGPTAADASVRTAAAADVPAIGAVQARAWHSDYARLLPDDVLAALDAGTLAEAWRGAVTTPPTSGHRVLVACAGPTVVGFAAVEPGGELVALLVDPAHQRRGHGSRLLNAVADVVREGGGQQLSAWSPVEDAPRTEFLASAGFAPDGARRSLALPGGGTLDETRLVAVL